MTVQTVTVTCPDCGWQSPGWLPGSVAKVLEHHRAKGCLRGSPEPKKARAVKSKPKPKTSYRLICATCGMDRIYPDQLDADRKAIKHSVLDDCPGQVRVRAVVRGRKP